MSLASPWDRGLLCLKLLEADPTLGGLVITSRASPVRDRFLQQLPSSVVRIHGQMDDIALFGGLDVTATLSTGRMVMAQGLATSGRPLLLTMAERLPTDRLARLISDALPNAPIIALDESSDGDPALAPLFHERLAFHVDLNDLALGDAYSNQPIDTDTTKITLTEAIQIFANASLTLGISSLRAPSFALKTARALAKIGHRNDLTQQDVTTAAMLVFAHRATQLPDHSVPNETYEQRTETDKQNRKDITAEDMMVEAIKTILPSDIMAFLGGSNRSGKGQGGGHARKSNRRGRPIPSRKGRPGSGKRLDVIATLRAAAPMHTLRQTGTARHRLQIRPSDLHIRQFEEKSDRLIIFAVDASGSSAIGRLAEAKGAVEYLLADAYARRDHVALVAFRGETAELLLPPTRSLVQTKRRLAALPGGGGTPLAMGLEQSLTQAISARRRGMTPTICILTDGRANIDRDGKADRKTAAQDAKDLAKLIKSEGIDTIVIDTGARPEPQLRTLASIMDANYISLPRANAAGISTAVAAVVSD